MGKLRSIKRQDNYLCRRQVSRVRFAGLTRDLARQRRRLRLLHDYYIGVDQARLVERVTSLNLTSV